MIDPEIDLYYNEEEWHNEEFSVDLMFSDNFGVSKIIFPDGAEEVLSETPKTINRTYSISAKGEYTFKVYDEAGNETVRSITVKYDSKAPEVNSVVLNPDVPTQQDINITVTASDAAEDDVNNRSGIKQISRVASDDINSDDWTQHKQ